MTSELVIIVIVTVIGVIVGLAIWRHQSVRLRIAGGKRSLDLEASNPAPPPAPTPVSGPRAVVRKADAGGSVRAEDKTGGGALAEDVRANGDVSAVVSGGDGPTEKKN